MSNLIAMECTKDGVSITSADGRTWSMTRIQIQAIYATKTGSASARRTATITDVLNSAQAALGVHQFNAAACTLDLDPNDLNKPLIMAAS